MLAIHVPDKLNLQTVMHPKMAISLHTALSNLTNLQSFMSESIGWFTEDCTCGCMIWLLPYPLTPLSCRHVVSLVCRRSSLLTGVTGEGGGGVRGAKSYDCEKAWPSISHWIFSAPSYLQTPICIILRDSIWYLQKCGICVHKKLTSRYLC